jgi:hypothetical protein
MTTLWTVSDSLGYHGEIEASTAEQAAVKFVDPREKALVAQGIYEIDVVAYPSRDLSVNARVCIITLDHWVN